ncbi:MAG TPA: plastocyanin/azurin family copper-binding protein [Methanoregulaceae archaeon]|nr:plastocyanin/azurin family copper-binding protein [Methanoregulaceae archaeon]
MKYPLRTIHWVALIATLSVIIMIAGCTSYSQPPGTTVVTQTPGTGGSTVTIQNFAFIPSSITIPRGTTVTWINQDPADHQVINDAQGSIVQGALFTSDPLPKGASYSFEFDNPGSYPYHCSIHPSMKGTVTVT